MTGALLDLLACSYQYAKDFFHCDKMCIKWRDDVLCGL